MSDSTTSSLSPPPTWTWLLAMIVLLLPAQALAAPAVHGVTPNQGDDTGGTSITVQGEGFEQGARVLVCGGEATGVQLLSPTSIGAVTPPGQGACDVEVVLADGSTHTLVAAFRYLETVEAETGGAATPASEQDEPEYQGEDTVVTGTRIPRRLKDTPVMTELIPGSRIRSKGAACLLDALTFEPGIRLDNQCSICNTSGVKLAGMPGRYTSLLIDGVPIYSSLGQTYGWLMVSAADIERIEIVKGPNSILYGTDAMGGVVNVITARPKEGASGLVNAELGHRGDHYLFGNGAVRKGPFSLSVVGSHTSHPSLDNDGDDVSEFAGYDRASFAGTIRLETAPVESMLRFSATQEKRQGGGLGAYNVILDDDVRRGFTESILSRRLEASFFLDAHVHSDVDLETTAAVSQHLQDSDYEGEVYVGRQWMVFIQESVVAKLHERYSLIGGVGYRGEFLDENLALSDYAYHMPGAFVQGDWMPRSEVELLHGIRFDYHSAFGPVVTPRVGLRVSPLKWLTLRATGGTGFRAPTTFYEYAHGVRPEGYELKMEADKPERSINAGGSVAFDAGREFRATISGGWSRVIDAITVDVDNDGDVIVHNVDEPLDVIPLELQIQSSPLSWLRIAGGYGHYFYDDRAGALVSAPPADVWDLSIDFHIEKIGLEAAINLELYGPMELSAVYGEAYNGQGEAGSGDMDLEMWLDPANADTSSKKLERSPWWGTIDLRVQQRIYKGLSVYAGVQNLADYHQGRVETPLMYPAEDDGSAGPADVVYIWGPMRGRRIYGGLRLQL